MKTSSRRSHLMHWAGLAAALALPAGAVLAQDGYPNKPVRLIVQYQAGGSTDTLARLISEGLSKRLGQPVLVENKAGAGGIIGTEFVTKSAPDGYTLLLTAPGPVTVNLVLYKKLPYDPRTDLRMVSDVARGRTVLVVNPSVPAKNFKELIEAVRKQPGKYAMGSWGPGTLPHQAQVFMDKAYGLESLHVAYKGEAPLSTDLLSGVIQMSIGTVSTLQPYIATGKMRALATIGPTRSKLLPNVPTFAEQGYKDDIYMITAPNSIMAPAKTPDAIVERLSREIAAVVRQPEVAKRIEELGAEPIGNTPAEATAAYKAFLPISLDLTRATGVTLD
jgi:tripartite-type tricarboxylate transporter receptor subunit TctC